MNDASPDTPPVANADAVAAFVERWRASGASERANAQAFLLELCDVLGVGHPDPATAVAERDAYAFERPVTFDDGDTTSTGFIDLYTRGHFVLEAKQGADAPAETEAQALGLDGPKRKGGTARRETRAWERAMTKAKEQARRYARALPEGDGWPPFLVVADVGFCFDLYADFSRQGKAYLPFPDPQRFRIALADLVGPDGEPNVEAVERLRLLWTDPMALDPQRRQARVTRDLAAKLAKVAASLEGQGHEPGRVAGFLLRALFSMFAEDVGLLPGRAFTRLLTHHRDREADDGRGLALLPDALSDLWRAMDEGGYSGALGDRVTQFNGGLFHEREALPLSAAQLDLLIEAARADWAEVEPAIFGTLLERALDPEERHRLGAHFTPRAYVERLVVPTLVEPLREEWQAAQAAAAQREAEVEAEGRPHEEAEAAAREELQAFHRRLCTVRVLDPACGSGNFLYVALEHLKRLEAEVVEAMGGYGGQLALDMTGGHTVTPQQLLGLEINPRAAAIAEVVLWIGYLQWHVRTTGDAQRLDPPILRDYGNIELQDALLDEGGKEPKRAAWPDADFIIGNPPFIGGKDLRGALGDDYTEALWTAYPDVPNSADLVMYFWHRAAEAVRTGGAERFGFITTNSITMAFNRRVVEHHMGSKPALTLAYAVPDHPWVDDIGSAAVRIAMTVGEVTEKEGQEGTVARVVSEAKTNDLGRAVEVVEETGLLLSDLRIGADVASAVPLKANEDLSNRGVSLFGQGFIVEPEEAEWLGLGRIEGLERHIRHYRNGRDITQEARGVMVIDLFGLTAEEVRDRFPAVYQHVRDEVKPDRDKNRRKSRRENWWLFGETNPKLREMLDGLGRYIATVETSKHRIFVFLDSEILPDNKLVAIASDDAYHLGVLSSRFHVAWALAAGGRLEDRPVYTKTKAFEPFPFPAPPSEVEATVRAAGERLDAHRKAVQAEHADLTLTGLYNVLERVRAVGPAALEEDERDVYDRGLVGVLTDLHDELDRAVATAYGWPHDLDDAEVLRRLVALNDARAEEEARGLVRYLRPSYQNPDGGDQGALGVEVAPKQRKRKVVKAEWPKGLADRARAVQRALAADDRPATPSEVAKRFSRARKTDVEQILETLAALGQARLTDDGRYAA